MKKIFLIIFSIFSLSYLYSQTSEHKWQRISGSWNIENSIAKETKGGSTRWYYYDILDHNSIITLQPFQNYSSISVDASVLERLKTPSEFMISFAVTSESQSWYYRMYAFKVTGGYWGIDNVSFIFSDRIDKTKPQVTQNNSFIKELASAKCSIKYDKMYNYRIVFEDENVVLYLDDKAILSYKFPEKSYEGRIAISSRNVKLAVDNVEIKKGDKVIFHDNFDKDSIFVKRLKATRESIPETETDKKP
jgi:hypothetical protein